MIEKYCYTCARAAIHAAETDRRGTSLVRCEICGTTTIHGAQPLAGPNRAPMQAPIEAPKMGLPTDGER